MFSWYEVPIIYSAISIAIAPLLCLFFLCALFNKISRGLFAI